MLPSIRSFWIRSCWIFVAIALIGSACGEQQSPETQGPNFVIILTDDQESSSLEHMPHLQELLVDEGQIDIEEYAGIRDKLRFGGRHHAMP